MAFNFPASPTTGQVVSVNGRDFLYNGLGWIPAPLGTDVAPIDQTSILGTDSLYGYRTGIGKVEWDYDVLKSDILASVPAGGASYNVTTWAEIQAICGSQATGDSVCINVVNPIIVPVGAVLRTYVKNVKFAGTSIIFLGNVTISGLEAGYYTVIFDCMVESYASFYAGIKFIIGDSQFTSSYLIQARSINSTTENFTANYGLSQNLLQLIRINPADTIIAWCNEVKNLLIDTTLSIYFELKEVFHPITNLYNYSTTGAYHTSKFTCDISGRFTIRCRYTTYAAGAPITVVLIPAIPAYINIHDAVLAIIRTASGGDSAGIAFPRFFLETAGNYWIAIAGGDVPGTKTEYRNDRGVGQYTSLLDGADMINLTAAPFTAQLYPDSGEVTAEFVLTGILTPSN